MTTPDRSRRPGSARANAEPTIDLGKERCFRSLYSRLRHSPHVGADRAAHREGVGHARGDDRLCRAGDLEKVILRCLRKDPQRGTADRFSDPEMNPCGDGHGAF